MNQYYFKFQYTFFLKELSLILKRLVLPGNSDMARSYKA